MPEIYLNDLPGFPNLFLDYVYEYENTASYYATNFRNTAMWADMFREVAGRRRPFSETLVSAIAEGYGNSEYSENTSKNLTHLRSQNCVAILTGQQLGVYGGPLYTIYKIISILKMSAKLNREYPAFKFVPVFWLEGDDHDYEEVRHLSLPDIGGELKQIIYDSENAYEEGRGSVGHLVFNEAIEKFHADFETSLRPTEFTPELMNTLRQYYKPGATFKQAFRHLLFDLFDKYGLVIFDPQHSLVKQLLRPVYLEAIKQHRQIATALIHRSAKLEELYHAQVKVKAVNLFFELENNRFSLEPEEDGSFRLRKKKLKFTQPELEDLINRQPEAFSPNVILRPICQDFLFPTGMYIGGPSEICYFAQVMPLYEMFGLTSPLLFPRSSVTLLEKQVMTLLEKYNVQFRDVFIGDNLLQQKVFASLFNYDVNKLFDDADEQIGAAMNLLKEQLNVLDKTIADAGERYKVKLLSNLVEYRGKAMEAQKRKNETIVRQLKKIIDAVFPQHTLQERIFNYFYFANKYGPGLVDQIYEKISIEITGHQLIEL